VVVGLGFLLLAVVLRSLLIPLLASIMNLLSFGAALGVMTAHPTGSDPTKPNVGTAESVRGAGRCPQDGLGCRSMMTAVARAETRPGPRSRRFQ
jgi:hypothetical protein